MIELGEVLLITNGDHQGLTSFFAVAQGEDLRARRLRSQQTEVSVDLGHVIEHVRRTDDVVQGYIRGRNTRAPGQVIDELRNEKRLLMRAVGSELLDLPRVIGVVFKLAVGRSLCPGCRREDK